MKGNDSIVSVAATAVGYRLAGSERASSVMIHPLRRYSLPTSSATGEETSVVDAGFGWENVMLFSPPCRICVSMPDSPSAPCLSGRSDQPMGRPSVPTLSNPALGTWIAEEERGTPKSARTRRR